MFMEEKSSRYPIGQNESNGCSYVGFSIRKILYLYYLSLKKKVLKVHLWLFLLQRLLLYKHWSVQSEPDLRHGVLSTCWKGMEMTIPEQNRKELSN